MDLECWLEFYLEHRVGMLLGAALLLIVLKRCLNHCFGIFALNIALDSCLKFFCCCCNFVWVILLERYLSHRFECCLEFCLQCCFSLLLGALLWTVAPCVTFLAAFLQFLPGVWNL